MLFFYIFIFYLIGILAYLYSHLILLAAIIPSLYLIFYKKDKKILLYLSFTLIGYAMIFLYPKGSENITSVTGIVFTKKDNYYLILSLTGKYYVYEKNSTLTLFSIVKLEGYTSSVSFTHYESVFSFQDYLKSKGVFYKFTATSTNIIFQNPLANTHIKNYVLSCLNSTPKLVVSSLLFGDSLSSIEDSALTDFNLISLLSVSGLHISLLLSIFENFLVKKQREKYIFLQLFFLMLVLFFSNYKYSIRRIFILKALSTINYKTKFKLSYINRVSLTALILLFFEPYSILSASFYYSIPLSFYMAIFPKKKANNFKAKTFFNLECMIFFLPFNLISSAKINFISYFIQLAMVYISHFLYLFSLTLFLIPQIGYIANYLIEFILEILSFLNGTPFSLITGVPSIIFIICFYSLLIIFKIFQSYHFKQFSHYASSLLLVTSSLLFIPDVFPKYEVTFIDVGQGDCTLIRYQDKNMLIDTGGNVSIDIATECLIPYFNKQKITSLDSVFITHLDYDHYGALESLNNSFQIDNIYYVEDFLSNNNTLYIDDFKIENLNIYTNKSEDTNYNSGIYSFQIKDTSFLIMGDAPKEIETKLIKDNPSLTCDVLKIGHHGSNTSSSENFLKQCNPQLAIISVGLNNSYKHPSKETLTTLNKLSITYKRTDELGSITIKC